MQALVLGNAKRSGVSEAVERLLPFLRQHAEIVAVDLRQEVDISTLRADLALVFGGDGAILRAARQMGYRQIPVLGINLGKLGFLADLSPAELVTCFPDVVAGKYRITRHTMFECLVEQSGQSNCFLGLNEIVLHTGPSFHMLELDLAVDGETVTRFSGDGLILSTPVGSTAHSLSAGGPILGQELAAFVITPICPHTLTMRSVVDSAAKVYEIRITSPGSDATLIVDGQDHIPVGIEHQITLRRARVDFQLIKVAGRSYFQTLRDKLRWGTPPNYRREPEPPA